MKDKAVKEKVIEKVTIVKGGSVKHLRIIQRNGENILQKRRHNSKVWTDIMKIKLNKIKLRELK